jgi:hypothetical protein
MEPAWEHSPERDTPCASSMKAFKTICVLFGFLSLTSAFRAGWEIYLTAHTLAMQNAILETIWTLVFFVFWVAALYGVRKKKLIAWKVGWGLIAADLVALPAWAMSATSRIPRTDDPRVAAAALVVGGVAVVLYWGVWWKKQKSHFVRSTTDNELHK